MTPKTESHCYPTNMPKLFLIPLFFLAVLSLRAQGNDLLESSEPEVKTEEIFIDGNREKLLGNWEKAVVKFKEVLEKDPKNDAASYELARVYEALKDTDKALVAARNAVEWNPANPWYKYYLADLYQKTEEKERTLNTFKSKIEQQ